MRGILLVIGSVVALGCRGPREANAPSTRTSGFAVAVEGTCPKLRAHAIGQSAVLVIGTYGLDEGSAWTGTQTARAAQALAVLRPVNETKVTQVASAARGAAPTANGPLTAVVRPKLLEGLPRTTRGWIDGDVEVGGADPSHVWLERTLRTPAKINQGALFETSHDSFTWTGTAWSASAGRDAFLRGPGATLPTAAMFCGEGRDDEVAFSLLATERAPDGTTFVAGRCEDELHRPVGPLLFGRFDVRARGWTKVIAPSSTLFEGADAIVNAGIVSVTSDRAWLYAYKPFSESTTEEPYLIEIRGDRVTPIAMTRTALPFHRSITSLARSPDDGALWMIAGFSELYRWDGETFHPVTLPPPRFIAPLPTSVRLLDVQATHRAVWVHGAVPIVREDGARSREHILYTTAPWGEALHCDREREVGAALERGHSAKATLGVVPKRTPNKDGT